MLDEIRRANRDTRAQYALMIVFGALCVIAAFAPLQESIRIAIVGTLFGFTAGIWVSHLLQVVQSAAEANRNGTDSSTLESR
jgi:Flp pilus assembly pilin Flp